MGGERRLILVGLAVAMVMGIGIYLRLWTLDYSVSSVDTELLRKQFDLANREAMDESAEWRLKFDVEAERANKCDKELTELVAVSVGSDSLIVSRLAHCFICKIVFGLHHRV
ncbi:hypothetical protein Q3G72_009103 [Acer saccharum]|nr:hypothetical protein Q3G72_009103 [Acer saccharum]